MIDPDEIRRNATRLYGAAVRAWLAGDETAFPKEIPFNRVLPRDDLPAAIKAVQRLRDGSKERTGYGYAVAWEMRKSRAFGDNPFPQRITFETRDDLLRYIGRQREFAALSAAVQTLREAFPPLETWIRSNWQRLATLSGQLDGLIAVVRHFEQHPRPGCFARALPIPVDTKFVERHASILSDWLDLLLPPRAIRADESRFERRYGLRYPDDHVLVRLVDERLRPELGFPCGEFSVPLHTFARLPVHGCTVVIVENKINLLTFPDFPRGVALGGMGQSVTVLRSAEWLGEQRLYYWGDLDGEGLQILSECRAIFPHVQSFLMDRATLDRFRDLARDGSGRPLRPPAHLTEAEQAAFEICQSANLRIEQERIPQREVLAELERLGIRS